MNTARGRFRIGDRVRYSAEGRRVCITQPLWRGRPVPTAGVVVGFGRDDHMVRVRLDGWAVSHVAVYHEEFLEHEPADLP